MLEEVVKWCLDFHESQKEFSSWVCVEAGVFLFVFILKSTKSTEFPIIMPEPPSCLSRVWIPSAQIYQVLFQKRFTRSTQVQFLETGDVEIPLISEAGLCRAPEAGTV